MGWDGRIAWRVVGKVRYFRPAFHFTRLVRTRREAYVFFFSFFWFVEERGEDGEWSWL